MQTPPDFFVSPLEFIQFYWDIISPYLLLGFQLLLLFILYAIVTRLARRSLIRIGMTLESTNGVVLILRVLFFIAAIIITGSFFQANVTFLISLTAVFGTALGLAFSQAVSNMVSGLYVLFSRPFRVGDYVRIGSTEGVVREITLNYTQILLPDETWQIVPNSKVVTSEVTNFRVKLQELVGIPEKDELSSDVSRSGLGLHSVTQAITKLRSLAADRSVYRYTFDLNVHMGFDHNKVRRIFDSVCKKWEDEFLVRPTYFVWASPTAAVTYRFAYVVEDPMTIIKKGSAFMEDLLSVYWESYGAAEKAT